MWYFILSPVGGGGVLCGLCSHCAEEEQLVGNLTVRQGLLFTVGISLQTKTNREFINDYATWTGTCWSYRFVKLTMTQLRILNVSFNSPLMQNINTVRVGC